MNGFIFQKIIATSTKNLLDYFGQMLIIYFFTICFILMIQLFPAGGDMTKNILQYYFKQLSKPQMKKSKPSTQSKTFLHLNLPSSNPPTPQFFPFPQHHSQQQYRQEHPLTRQSQIQRNNSKRIKTERKVALSTKEISAHQYVINQRSMEYFESKRSRSKYILQGSEDDFSYSSPNQLKTAKNPHQNFQALFLSRDRFSQFVNTLGQLRHTEIREDILIHCQQNSKKQRIYQAFMSDQTILKIINLRIDKMIKNKRIKKNWSQQDVQILIWVISKYADKKRFQDIEKELDSQDWEMIASLIPGVTGESCMFKWLSLKKINLATNNWSEEESNLLSRLVNQKGFQGKNKDSKDWKLVSQKLYFLNNRQDKIFRNAKQCRQHWNCYLNPNLKKGPWKPQQDIQLLKCIKQNKGSKKWSQIVKYFDGRTENALKNRYTLIIEKQKKHNKHKNELQIIQEYLVRCYVDQFTTQIKQYSSSEQDQCSNEVSLEQMCKEEEKPSYQKHQQSFRIEQENINAPNTPITPITPIKIERFTGFFSRFDFNSIQLGTLNNGVFERTQIQTDKSSTSTPENKLKMKKYNSSYL